MMKASIIDIEPTTVCNLACPFCFGPKDIGCKSDLPLKQWIHILDIIKEAGGKGIVVSGGEPTIYHELHGLLQHAKKIGLSTVVSTHGRFKDRVLNISSVCDWIALPVDGLSSTINTIMRGDNWGFKEFKELVLELKGTNPNLKIKLGTVVTLVNLHEVKLMFEYVNQNLLHQLFDTWKLYQYTPRRKFKHLKKSFQIPDSTFQSLKGKLNKAYPWSIDKVYFSSIKDHESGYVFIYNNGDVCICDVGPNLIDIPLGNVIKLGKKVFSDLNRLDPENHIKNYYNTYNS